MAAFIKRAKKYKKERYDIIADNEDMHNQLDEMKSAYSKKERDLEWTYKSKIRGLEKENKYRKKIDKKNGRWNYRCILKLVKKFMIM